MYVECFEICCLESNAEKRDMAKRMFCNPCKKECLLSFKFEDAMEILIGCIEEVENFSRAEKKQYLFDKLLHSGGRHTASSFKPNYNLGVGENRKCFGVCHMCFQTAYGIGHSMLDELRAELRKGSIRVPDSGDKPINDRSGGEFLIIIIVLILSYFIN